MKIIELTAKRKGVEYKRLLKIDENSLEKIGGKSIFICGDITKGNDYPSVAINKVPIKVHKLITNEPMIDHKDGDRYNCTIENLRPCTNQQNSFNRGPQRNNKTGFKGVFYRSSPNLINHYEVAIRLNGKTINIGYYATPIEGAKAYNEYVLTKLPEDLRAFAYLNKVL